MRSSRDEASTSTELINTPSRGRAEPVLDLVAAVNTLHELSAQQLSKLIKDSGNSIIRYVAEDGSQFQIDAEKFARYLPLHLIAVIMAWERDKSTFKYLLCGILLLHSMCDLASRVPKIEQILLDDVKVSEQLIDLVFYLLVVLGAYKKDNRDAPNDMVLLHSALVACSLKLLTVIVSPQYQEVAQVLTSYYKVDVFMEATFTAVHKDVKFLQSRLSAEHVESSANTSPTAEETLNHLCQQCDSSLQFLQSLCQQKLFRERLVKNKELCGNGGVLVLAQAVMSLNISSLYDTFSSYMTSVSRLKSKALSILLHLCEAESVSYLDEVASTPRSQDLAKSIALQVLELLKKLFGIDHDKSNVSSEKIYPKGQLELNAMRLADVFSDDSNFRSFIMINFTEALAAIFLFSHGEFLSSWCSSDLPVCEDDVTLDVPRASYAHQRTSLLIKMIANLHCYVPDVCQDEKGLFLNKFVQFFQKESQNLSNGCSYAFDAEKTTTVTKNLCSLLSHAESLVPRFLNEDDVQLLRFFIRQFESLILPASCEDNQCKVSLNHGNGSSDMNECMVKNVTTLEVDRIDAKGNGNEQSTDGERKCGITEQGKPSGISVNLGEVERDSRTFETSGSDSSPTRGKNHMDQMDVDQIKGGVFGETQDDSKVEALHSDEKLQRKRKRTVMNDRQITLIESAIVDEPDMHRNSAMLQHWAEKLSFYGAEVTTSRLKNWLNNRKAKLARAAKDGRAPCEGDNLDKQGGSGIMLHSPHSPIDSSFVPSASRGNFGSEVIDCTPRVSIDEHVGTSLAATRDVILPSTPLELGQYVTIMGEKAEEIGKGKVFQMGGQWFGWNLEESGGCVIDVIELTVDRFSKILHPMEITCTTFDQAEKRFGSMRVLWDFKKLFPHPTP
ncbi:nodulin homeobox isoform X2 [Henckelia pumila]|uniref:nodulin homeobox isoform X2 n=1 Tax=Henckelia pumila TaxID=405737 RepID=UPI003C6DCFAE